MRIEDKEPLGQKVLPERDDSPISIPTEKDYVDISGEHLDIAKAHMSWVRVLLEMSREASRQRQIEMVRLRLQGRKWSHRYSGPPMTIISNPGTTPATITELEKDNTHANRSY